MARPRLALPAAALVSAFLGARSSIAATIVVPDDQPTIQSALNAAAPGDDVQVKSGVYAEQISFPIDGAPGAYITLEAFPGDSPVLDGSAFNGATQPFMIAIASKSWVKVIGFEIRNLGRVRDGSGIRIEGSGSNIEIRDNRIHDIRGKNAMGITAYGTDSTSISKLIIDGNEIYDCDPAPSEALTLNGNVEQFQVTGNVVRKVNNIGIVCIGGETDIQPDPMLVARNGVVRGNRVERANSIYGGGFAGAIYVDGGRDIVVERNVVTGSDMGIEVGAENAGVVTTGIVVRDNLLYRNDKACIALGGYAASVGRVKNSSFLNNTCYQNDTVRSGFGELWIQYADDNIVRNNIFHAGAQNLLLVSEVPTTGNALDYNLWFAPGGSAASTFRWQGDEYGSFAAYLAGSLQDVHSGFADAHFFAPGAADFHLEADSPAIDGGDPWFAADPMETDIDGAARVNGVQVDVGADERTCGDGVVDAGESCDDGNVADCDGCDRNCTASATCGNRIVCGAEQCDDGNTADGDCCTAACAAQASGDPCDDGDLCTRQDQCDGTGACAGTATPEPVCRMPSAGGASLLRLIDSHTGNHRDVLYWSLTKGDVSALDDFGDPVTDVDYTLCVYDAGSPTQPTLHFSIPHGGLCGERAEWRSFSNGYRYTNRCVADDGVFSVNLLRRADGRVNIRVQGRRERLRLPSLGFVAPVSVQLRNEIGGCWGASFTAPLLNTPEAFKAKTP